MWLMQCWGVGFWKVLISRPDTMVSSSIAQLKIVIEQVLLSKISRDLSPILSSFQELSLGLAGPTGLALGHSSLQDFGWI